ncbi:hypothetical protein PR048_008205 [Dryococelus australis]|uniref:Uncharacterized protein n=1 Tax=Dryococelus australis TaxID=614101 RepID=A0ABQ9HY36_9NEOP|nr:hypothetical protein PR048_008205 [Dryococelus australis]
MSLRKHSYMEKPIQITLERVYLLEKQARTAGTGDFFQKIKGDYTMNILSKLNSYDKDPQDAYIQRHIEVKVVSKRQPRKEESKARNCNYAYFVEVGGQHTSVCKSAFISKSIGSYVRAIKADNIYKMKKPNELLEVKVSHYANRDIKYLKAGLNVKTMHFLVYDMFPEEKVTYSFYLKYFQENYLYKYGHPMKDLCGKCEELNMKIKTTILNATTKYIATAEKIVHIKRSQKFYKKIQEIEKLTKAAMT